MEAADEYESPHQQQFPASHHASVDCDWSSLSTELLVEVCKYLGHQSLAAARQVCSNWRDGTSQHVGALSLGLPSGGRAYTPWSPPCSAAASACSLYPASELYHMQARSAWLQGGSARQMADVHGRSPLPPPGPFIGDALLAAAHNAHDAAGAAALALLLGPAHIPSPAASSPHQQLAWHQEAPWRAQSCGGLLHVGPHPAVPPHVRGPQGAGRAGPPARDLGIRVRRAFPCASHLVVSVWPALSTPQAHAMGTGRPLGGGGAGAGHHGAGAGGSGSAAQQEEAVRDTFEALQLLCCPRLEALTLVGDIPQHLLREELPAQMAGAYGLSLLLRPGTWQGGKGGQAEGRGSGGNNAELTGGVGGSGNNGSAPSSLPELTTQPALLQQKQGLTGSGGTTGQQVRVSGNDSGGDGASGAKQGSGGSGGSGPGGMRGSHGSHTTGGTNASDGSGSGNHGSGDGSGNNHGSGTNHGSGNGSGNNYGSGSGNRGGCSNAGGNNSGAPASEATKAQGAAGAGAAGSGPGAAGQWASGGGGRAQGVSQSMDSCGHEVGNHLPMEASGAQQSLPGPLHLQPLLMQQQAQAGQAQGQGQGLQQPQPQQHRAVPGQNHQNSGSKNDTSVTHSLSGGRGSSGANNTNTNTSDGGAPGGSDSGGGGGGGVVREGGAGGVGAARAAAGGGSGPSSAATGGPTGGGSGAGPAGVLARPGSPHPAPASAATTGMGAGAHAPPASAATHGVTTVTGTHCTGGSSATHFQPNSLKSGSCLGLNLGPGPPPSGPSGGSGPQGSGAEPPSGSRQQQQQQQDASGGSGSQGNNQAAPPSTKAATGAAAAAAAKHAAASAAAAAAAGAAQPAHGPGAAAAATGAAAAAQGAAQVGHAHLMIPAAADDMGQGQPSTCFGLLHNLANLRQLRLWDIKGLPTPETLECLSGLRHLVVVDVRALLPLQVDAAEVAQGRRSPAVHDEHLKALGHITTLTGLHLNCVTGVTGPGLSHLSHLTSLVSLSLSDGLDAGLVGPSHLMALASVLPRLLALDIGRMSQPHDMHGGPLVLPGLPGAGGAGGGGAAGLASTGPMAWGSCLTSFANLRTLGLQAMHSLEPLTLSSLPQLLHLESLDLEGTDLPYGEVMLLLELAAPLTQLRRLRLGEAVLCDAHLHALAGISQLRALALTHVDVRTRDACGWTALGALSELRSFEFEEWNNPVLSVGNMAVLTDESVCIMAQSWRRLEQLRYTGKVQLTSKAREALAGLPHLSQLCILGSDGTQCIGSRTNVGATGGQGGARGRELAPGNVGSAREAGDRRCDGGSGNGNSGNVGGSGGGPDTNQAGASNCGLGGSNNAHGSEGHHSLQQEHEAGATQQMLQEGFLLLQAAGHALLSGVPHVAAGAMAAAGHHEEGRDGAGGAEAQAKGGGAGAENRGALGAAAGMQAGTGREALAGPTEPVAGGMGTGLAAPQQGAPNAAGNVHYHYHHHHHNHGTHHNHHASPAVGQQVQGQGGAGAASARGSSPDPMPAWALREGAAFASMTAADAASPNAAAATPVDTLMGGVGAGAAPDAPLQPTAGHHHTLAAAAAAAHRANQQQQQPGGVQQSFGGLQVRLLLPHTKLSSCNGYLTHSGTPSLTGSQGSEESVNWLGAAGADGDVDTGPPGGGCEEGEVQGVESLLLPTGGDADGDAAPVINPHASPLKRSTGASPARKRHANGGAEAGAHGFPSSRHKRRHAAAAAAEPAAVAAAAAVLPDSGAAAVAGGQRAVQVLVEPSPASQAQPAAGEQGQAPAGEAMQQQGTGAAAAVCAHLPYPASPSGGAAPAASGGPASAVLAGTLEDQGAGMAGAAGEHVGRVVHGLHGHAAMALRLHQHHLHRQANALASAPGTGQPGLHHHHHHHHHLHQLPSNQPQVLLAAPQAGAPTNHGKRRLEASGDSSDPHDS